MRNHSSLKSLSFNSRIQDENKHINKISRGKSHSFASRISIDFNLQFPELIQDLKKTQPQISLDRLTQEVVFFVESSSSSKCDDEDDSSQPHDEIPNAVIHFLNKLEAMIQQYESTSEKEDSLVFGQNADEDVMFIAAITRLSSLIQVFGRLKLNDVMSVMNQASVILHHAMVIFEYELRYLFEEEHEEEGKETKENVDKEEEKNAVTFPPFSPQTINSIRVISNAMILSGYELECCNVFVISRRQMFEDALKKQGFEKMSVDDVQKMNWETLEGLITTWIRFFKHCSTTLFPNELKFYDVVLEGHTSTKHRLFTDLSNAVFAVLITFAVAVSMTKRSTEKLFKFLDMYEILRDMSKLIEKNDERNESLEVEFTSARCRLGESVVSIFYLLENSIRNDSAKTPVPNGAVHPLARYTMNYLKYACEYKHTLEQVFHNHLRIEESHKPNKEGEEKQFPFAIQIQTIMDLLDTNLDVKSELYKDKSLRFIFLMNNGRYMLQNVKGTPEIHQVLGDNWCRKRSTDVRKYHKGYQRETWCKVLQCFTQEGLQVNGKIQKPVLKERFNHFNKLFDEIHKTQSTWAVNDEQLQTELRVSISAIMIPAYRSFLARFGQKFTPGRQVEKYIKYQPEDIETVIEELFDGHQHTMSMARRRN